MFEHFSASSQQQSWCVVIPFKGTHTAKSRLSVSEANYSGIDEALRARLATAFLYDTVTAVLSASHVTQVIVVSGDPTLHTRLPEATIIPDPGTGLNAAISAGIAHARTTLVKAPIAVLTGDLPGLDPQDLQTALQLAEQHPLGVVADHAGTGTTTLTGLPGAEIIPQFGENSFLKHLRGGHSSLSVPLHSTLRRDVDTPVDLQHVLHQGVGEATAAAMAPRQTTNHRTVFSLEGTQ